MTRDRKRRGHWNAPAPTWTVAGGTRGEEIYVGPCGKRVYKIRQHAANDAEVVRRNKTRTQEGGVDPYWCRQCRGFHVGHRGGKLK